MTVDGHAFSLESGQSVLLMPGEVHDISCQGDEELEFLAISAPPFDVSDVYPVEAPGQQ